ncbi:hypothetical protein HYH03_017297 [Edaphochlamys debaryana]|uniref:Cytochrome P450 n=1 Tax=Edaphochlamys debaryana TaxID=47281 RepID=A0A835XHG0_9CHLO|nr:hypothetical protein HYH03_017297 [Edaphochlamys debaryana]|eukprot:KAG2483841.1 hypothetical protein HYH03_017297 [Edaphochlamys debaryana]
MAPMAFRTWRGTHLCVSNPNGLVTQYELIGPGEVFVLDTYRHDGTVALKSCLDGRHVSAWNDGTVRRVPQCESWQRLTLLPLPLDPGLEEVTRAGGIVQAAASATAAAAAAAAAEGRANDKLPATAPRSCEWRSAPHRTFLSARMGGGVKQAPAVGPWEVFTLVEDPEHTWRPRAEKYNLPPGKMDWPIGGLQFFKTGFRNLFHFSGLAAKQRILGKRTICIRGFKDIKAVFNGEGDFAEVNWPPATRALLGERSVTFATGAYHRSLRRLLGPCFAPAAIDSYLPSLECIVERYCAQWADATAAAVEKGGAGSGGDLALLPKMQKEARLLTFDVIATVVAGLRLDPEQVREVSDTFDTFTRGLFFPVPLRLPGSPFTKALDAQAKIYSILDTQLDILLATAATGQPPTTNGQSLAGGSIMERLLGMRDDEGKPLSREAIKELAVNLLFAGHETTAASFIRLLLVLRSRPDVVSRLRAEQAAVAAAQGEAVTGSSLRCMPYLDAVIKELWRLEPVVPMVPRRARKGFKLTEGWDVPQGWGLALGISEPMALHPTWAPWAGGKGPAGAPFPPWLPPPADPASDPLHPALFNPDRWRIEAHADTDEGEGAGEGAGARAADASPPPGTLSCPLNALPPEMLVFGGGVRRCLGANLAWAELKVVTALLVRRYDFAAALEDMEVSVFPALTVSQGFPMFVRPLSSELWTGRKSST